MRLTSLTPLSTQALKPSASRTFQSATPSSVSAEPRFGGPDPFKDLPFHEKLLLNALSVSTKLINIVSFGRWAQDAKGEPWIAAPFFKKD